MMIDLWAGKWYIIITRNKQKGQQAGKENRKWLTSISKIYTELITDEKRTTENRG